MPAAVNELYLCFDWSMMDYFFQFEHPEMTAYVKDTQACQKKRKIYGW